MLQYRPACWSDIQGLCELRARAMEPSLMVAGRFDPTRVRRRLLDNYEPMRGWVVDGGDEQLAFWQWNPGAGCLYLSHLYVDPSVQGQGYGRIGAEGAKALAGTSGVPLRLHVLKGSVSENFYHHLGFVRIGEAEWDYLLEWKP